MTGAGCRVDSWLWSVRLCKTRSAASAACKGGRVRVNGVAVKPARQLAIGDEVRLQAGQRERIVEVVRPITKRVGAPVAAQCMIDRSPPPPPKPADVGVPVRDRGAGRPTKKDRRRMDALRGRR